ncbi:MAG: arginine--tRNA ligase [Planctomycetes bacterium]|nr:arginine--tRNA ligase [Planctomycetota bacterium]
MPLIEVLEERVRTALASQFGEAGANIDPVMRRAQDERFGDYQSNCAMGLGKRLGRNPREVAEDVISALDVADLCEPPQRAGPGFINFQLKPSALSNRLVRVVVEDHAAGEDRLGADQTTHPEIVAVDMSSPNLAKEMHVGHLRSTVIGDCISRLLEFQGHTVHRINHVGDWGTQFGMLVAYLRRTKPEILDNPDDLEIADLEAFYVQAKAVFDRDSAFAAESRQAVVALQSGDPITRKVWKAFCAESLRHCHQIYQRLGVTLEDRGESFYNDRLHGVVRTFRDQGLAVESDGAVCVFLDGFKARDGQPLPMIIQKSDGGYNYATTDLAAVQHRIDELGATMLIYVVGVTQKQHLEQLFAAARKADWATDAVRLIHLAFGSMLGKDGKPFKTRQGGTIKLKDLLDEAVARARKVIDDQETRATGPDSSASETGPRMFAPAQIDHIAETVGIAAVKYFDLCHSLGSDYKFDVDSMCSLDGNTAPYLLYAYTRIRGIGRKAAIDFNTIPTDTPLVLEHQTELLLAKSLCRWPEVFRQTAAELRPNILTDYLFELSKSFSLFYDRARGVRVVDARPESTRLSRLRLCDLTARTLGLGLGLLGIPTLERM